MTSMFPYLADALVVLGGFIMTLGVYGMSRMPDTYPRLRAASKTVFLGVISLLMASVVTGDPEIIFLAVLIGVFLILTAPVSAHMIGRAAYQRGERMVVPEAVDESGRDLPGRGK